MRRAALIDAVHVKEASAVHATTTAATTVVTVVHAEPKVATKRVVIDANSIVIPDLTELESSLLIRKRALAKETGAHQKMS
jgi:hypothetical protein